MNENWLEIVDTLQHYLTDNALELKYQSEVETCLKLLGWRKSNKTMQSQVVINIGHKNSIRPDIVLYKNGKSVMPIEIKRPCNKCSEKQEGQLMSYMRQLKLNVGLYIGENLQLFYDNPEDFDNPISVFRAEIKANDVNGMVLCDLLSYDKFDIKRIEDHCKECYNQLIARNNLHKRFSEFFSINNSNKNVLSLIKDKFVKEGFDSAALDEELKSLEIIVGWKQSGANNISSAHVNMLSAADLDSLQSYNSFSFNGFDYYCKRRFVLELVKDFVRKNKSINFKELLAKFPDELHTNALGVVRMLYDVKQRIGSRPDLKNRYFFRKDDVIRLSDGTEVVVNNQWGKGKHFNQFLSVAGTLYKITGRNYNNNTQSGTGKTGSDKKQSASKLKLTFSNGFIISEKDAISSFKKFIEYLGVDKVAALNIPGRKDVLLLSKNKSSIYSKHQREMPNGYFLFANYSTNTLRMLIERIAMNLQTDIAVELIPK
ncbi:MAG: GxxExxY protein [Muribaculaceae bacterium]|nr:GxxExxY protein [Muribaculaceae bacterium]